VNDNAERKRLIAEGAAKGGAEGAFWRLMLHHDLDEAVPRWIAGERIRGTPPDLLLEATANIIASIAIQVVGVVGGAKGADAAARDLMIRSGAHLETRVQEAVRSLEPRIRIVKD
jgi:hypothetical protein